MRAVLLRSGVALVFAAMLAGCGGASHGPAAPTTDVNPQTGSTGSGK